MSTEIFSDNELCGRTLDTKYRYPRGACNPKRWRVDRFGTTFPLDRSAESLGGVPLSMLETLNSYRREI